MKKKKVLSGALIAASAIETGLTGHHSDAVAPPQPHIELEIATPPATTASVISASGAASAAPFALDADDLGALPFRTRYDSYTNLSAVLQIFQDDAIVVPHEEGNAKIESHGS